MFLEVQAVKENYGYIDRNERYRFLCPIIMKYLEKKIEHWSVANFFDDRDIQKPVLYAITEMTEFVMSDLDANGRNPIVKGVCDRNNQKYVNGFHGRNVIGIEELVEGYKSEKYDKVIVCSIFHANEVFEELQEKGILLEDLISVVSIVFD